MERIISAGSAAAEPTALFLLPADLFLRPGTLDEPERLQVLEQLLHLVANENMKKTYRLAILSQKGLRERILTSGTPTVSPSPSPGTTWRPSSASTAAPFPMS